MISQGDWEGLEPQAFTKYQTRGAYHWVPWYRRTLHHDARYRIAHRLVAEDVDLDQAIGLDVGCGDGRFIHLIRSLGGRIIGLDASLRGLSLSQEMLLNNGLYEGAMICGSCYEMPLSDGSVDYVVALEVIEHLKYPGRFLSEVQRVLRPDGCVVMSTPHQRYSNGSQEVLDPFHVKEYTAKELDEMMRIHFDYVEVFGGNPTWLVAIVEGFGGKWILAKLWRGVIRTLCMVTVNPFVYVLSKKPNKHWGYLYVRCW